MTHRPLFAALVAGLLSGGPAVAQDSAGPYLAARAAASGWEFDAALRYFTDALRADPANPSLLEGATIAAVALSDFDRAGELAREMAGYGIESQVGHAVQVTLAAREGDWLGYLEAEPPLAVSPLFDGLARGWALLGDGQDDAALAAFDAVTDTEGMRAYGQLHKGFALAATGDLDAALAIFETPGDGARALSPRAVIAQAQILSEQGRNDDALALLDAVFGTILDPTLEAMKARLRAGETVPYDLVTDAREGLAETAYMIATLLGTEAREDYILQYARMAQALNPRMIEAILLSAELLQRLERFDLASETFALVPQDDPAWPSAELGRIDSLRFSDRIEEAVEVADSLARARPDLPFVQSRLGDVLREAEQFDAARDAYSRAIEGYPEDDPNLWITHYARAISAFELDDWPPAEADFRRALELNPEQPQVLNWLGYSLVERGEKLDEALDMIERAVEARPDSGAIIDSLGWVYFKLGRYDEAVEPLERAAALEATDPIVNDHLGDAYFVVGRQREARFQWQRALSFDPEPELADRIRAKLAGERDPLDDTAPVSGTASE